MTAPADDAGRVVLIRSYGGDLIRTHVDPCKEHRG